jgi:rRNA-processing protein EBP2
MVKTDAHMTRIRSKLIDETASVKKSEEARRQRDQRRFGKQIQAQIQQERQQKAKSLSDRVAAVKKKRKLDQATDVGLDDVELDIAIESDNEKKSAHKNGTSSKRRAVKDSKYGFGGRKRGSKRNTKESSQDFAFPKSANKKPGVPGKKKATKRPGKTQRTNQKSKRK